MNMIISMNYCVLFIYLSEVVDFLVDLTISGSVVVFVEFLCFTRCYNY